MKNVDSKSIKISNVQKVVAKRMHESIHTAAQVTFHSCCRADNLISSYKSYKLKNPHVSIQDFIILCVIKSLEDNPLINSTFQNDEYFINKDINLNFAVSLGDDLLVAPQIIKSNLLTFDELIDKRKELSTKAKDNKLSPSEMKPGSFTISNLGDSPVLGFSPIINLPQVAILGIAGISKKVIKDKKGNFLESEYLYFSLTVDHRVINGSTATNFVKSLVHHIEAL